MVSSLKDFKINNLFYLQMISRVKPEHQSPIESLRWIACAGCAKSFPYVWYRRHYAIMNMCWRGSRVPGFAKSADEFSRPNIVHGSAVDGIQMKVFVNSPLRAKHENALARLARHFLGIDYKTTCLGHDRRADLSEDVDSCMGMSALATSPWPVPEALMIIVRR